MHSVHPLHAWHVMHALKLTTHKQYTAASQAKLLAVLGSSTVANLPSRKLPEKGCQNTHMQLGMLVVVTSCQTNSKLAMPETNTNQHRTHWQLAGLIGVMPARLLKHNFSWLQPKYYQQATEEQAAAMKMFKAQLKVRCTDCNLPYTACCTRHICLRSYPHQSVAQSSNCQRAASLLLISSNKAPALGMTAVGAQPANH